MKCKELSQADSKCSLNTAVLSIVLINTINDRQCYYIGNEWKPKGRTVKELAELLVTLRRPSLSDASSLENNRHCCSLPQTLPILQLLNFLNMKYYKEP